MDDLNLSSDESVIYKSQKIISSGSGYEAIITDRRFILAESGARNDPRGTSPLLQSRLQFLISIPCGNRLFS